MILSESTWASNLDDVKVEYLSDQQIQIESTNHSAVITLSSNRQHFTARYLARLGKYTVFTLSKFEV